MNRAVDAYLKKEKRWRKELETLRAILLETGLTEELKWGHPCYTLDGKNVALIHGFKEYCAVLFHKGALLEDPKKVLVQQTKNVQSARQMRFTDVASITKLAKTLKAYVKEAAANERAGLEVAKKSTDDFEMPEELRTELASDGDLAAAFAKLTPGRQRAYLLHFAGAKLASTRAARVQKHIPRILEGLGLDD
jgi:uncharacterized protein YdeI (YjbR/CyaY-like superfamily)